MKLKWYGHACFLVETAEGSVVFDPYAPAYVPGLSLPELCADAVVLSHGHHDHNYSKAVALSGKKPSFTLKSFDSFHDDANGTLRGKNQISLIEAEGLRLVHCGDLGEIPEKAVLDALMGADVLLVPVGGHYTIDAKTAAEFSELIGAKLVVPMHYKGENFGFDVLTSVDAFLNLRRDVKFIDSNELEISAPVPSMTAVLRCPVN